jgi:hypothetical protein
VDRLKKGYQPVVKEYKDENGKLIKKKKSSEDRQNILTDLLNKKEDLEISLSKDVKRGAGQDKW